MFVREIQKDELLAYDLTKTAKSMFRKGDHSDETNVASFTISGDEATSGLIQNASENTELLFGYKSQQLVGMNIDFLCPKPFGNGVHARFLRHYIENAVSFVPVQRRIWARHVEGYAMKMDLAITPEQDAMGNLTFQGKLCLVSDSKEFIMVDSTGDILFFSQGVLSEMGLRVLLEGSQQQSRKIQQYMPSLANINFEEELDTQNIPLDLGGDEKYLMDMKSMKFPSAGISLVAIEFSRSESKEVMQHPEDQLIPDDESSEFHSYAECSVGDFGETSSEISRATITRRDSSISRMVQNRIETENKRLTRFTRQCKWICMLYLCFVASSLFINSNTYSRFNEAMEAVLLTGEKSYLIVETVVVMLHQWNIIVPNLENAALLREIVPSTISNNIDRIEILHQLLKPSAQYEDFAYDPNGASEYSSNHEIGAISFDELTLRYIANSRSFLQENQTNCQSGCQYVINNGAWELIDKHMEMLDLFSTNVIMDLENAQSINGLQLVGGAILFTLTMVLLVIPQLHEVKRVKQDLANSIREINKKSLKLLAKGGHGKYEHFKQEIVRITTSSNPFSMNGIKEVRRQTVYGSMRVYDEDQTTVSTHVNRSFWNWFRFKRCDKVVPRNDKEWYVKQSDRKLFKSLVSSTLQLAFPLLLIFAYFAAVYFVCGNLQVSATQIITAIHSKTIRWVDLQRFHFAIETPESVPAWSRWHQNPVQYNETARSLLFLNSMKSQSKSIRYGNSQGLGVPLVDQEVSPELYHLEYVNACDIISTCPLDTNEPLMRDMHHGLDLTMDRLLHRCYEMLHNSAIEENFSLSSLFPLSDAIHTSIAFLDQRRAVLTSDTQTQLLVGAFLCLVLIFSVYWFMSSMFKMVNDQAVDAQTLLVLLPVEIILSVPKLKQMFDQYEKNS